MRPRRSRRSATRSPSAAPSHGTSSPRRSARAASPSPMTRRRRSTSSTTPRCTEPSARARPPTASLRTGPSTRGSGPRRSAPDREAALAELARRHAAAHAPVTPGDLAAWSGLPAADARRAFAAIERELEPVRIGDHRAWVPRGLEPGDPPPARLLPAFDGLLLGHRNRGLIVRPAHARAVLPGGGVLRPTLLARGRVEGRGGSSAGCPSWRRSRRLTRRSPKPRAGRRRMSPGTAGMCCHRAPPASRRSGTTTAAVRSRRQPAGRGRPDGSRCHRPRHGRSEQGLLCRRRGRSRCAGMFASKALTAPEEALGRHRAHVRSLAKRTLDPVPFGNRHVRAARVERLVARDEVGTLGLEPVEEDRRGPTRGGTASGRRRTSPPPRRRARRSARPARARR